MTRTLLATVLILSATIAFASTDSNGPNGILSTGLNGYNTNEELTGFEVSIGQVEPTRPGKSTPPPADSPSHSNSFITPAAVFVHQDPPLTADDATIDNHAEQVAGVMISMDERADVNGVKPVGVAQDVQLYSTAYVTSGTAGYQNALLAMQFIAEQNGDDVRAINNSWGKPLPSGASIDGNSQLTLGFDYLAKKHDVLYIVAGNEDAGGLPTPADNFNGMTIAGATRGPDDKYDTVDDRNNLNDHPIADRTGVSLLAPADSILVTGLNNAQATVGGTSIAAPQVTGTVALLQQYGNQRLTAANSLHWSDDYKQHTVMKAVLMNSADKISKQSDLPVQVAGVATLPVPTGGFLDQDKTVFRKDGGTWYSDTDAADKTHETGGLKPVDDQFGAGALNAKRALKQLSAGEFHSVDNGGPGHVPVIGWDYGHISDQQTNHYDFNRSLLAGSFISITLAWDRDVQFASGGAGGEYHAGDSFQASTNSQVPAFDQISGLELQLLEIGDVGSPIIAESVASGVTLQHIFWQIPTTDQYEIRVKQTNDNGGDVDYGLAWWTLGTGLLISDLGDINQDGHVDAKDIKAMMDALSNKAGYG